MLAAVKQNADLLESLNLHLKDQKEIVLAAVRNDGIQLQHASSRLRADREIVLTAVQDHCEALRVCHQAFQDDEEIVLAAINSKKGKYTHILSFISPRLKQKAEIVKLLSQKLGYVAWHDNRCSDGNHHLRNDHAFVLSLIQCPEIKNFVDLFARSTLQDKALFKAAIKRDYRAVYSIDPKFRYDSDLMLEAINQDVHVLNIIPMKLRYDKKFFFEVLKKYPDRLYYAHGAIRLSEDRRFIMDLLDFNPKIIEYVSLQLRDDKELMMKAIEKDPINRKYLSNRLIEEFKNFF
jgi:hypothetical protein